MLTRVILQNFKRFEKVDIELGHPVVFVGPNNSGKTTLLQALTLWEIGLKRWLGKRQGKNQPQNRPGITLNRRDFIAAPIPSANHLWRDLQVRNIQRTQGQTYNTQNVRIEIVVEGISNGIQWKCGLEFDYANAESVYCRPLRLNDETPPLRMDIPDQAGLVSMAFLPPMSGLASNEVRLDPGAINVRIGEGRTAEVLRNLCYQLDEEAWQVVANQIDKLFKVRLKKPEYIRERGEVIMSYWDYSGIELDLSVSGRGLQQTLLLLAYLAGKPGTTLLLDEPDAHLEILRQRQIYQTLVDMANKQQSQIIIATHSEVILNEAIQRDRVVAFLGSPHTINNASQLLKSLQSISFDEFYQAEQQGWVLYLEGATDLAILRALAAKLNHPLQIYLERPYVKYLSTNRPNLARNHFHGLREAKRNLRGFALFDRLETRPESDTGLQMYDWQRREIENYFCFPQTLRAYAQHLAGREAPGPLFEYAKGKEFLQAMETCIADLLPPTALRDLSDRWWVNSKSSDDFLDRLFETFFDKVNLPVLMRKSDYYKLVEFVPAGDIDPEIGQVMDRIVEVARDARPTDK